MPVWLRETQINICMQTDQWCSFSASQRDATSSGKSVRDGADTYDSQAEVSVVRSVHYWLFPYHAYTTSLQVRGRNFYAATSA